MTSRIARLWQPGNPQRRCLLPDFWMAVVESPTVGRHRLPRNAVKFECDTRMSKHDIREYLTKIYQLPVRDIRTEVQMGEVQWNTPKDYRYKKAMWKEADKKYAYVFMAKDFEFDYPRMFDVDEDMKEVEKAKKQREAMAENAKFVNRDRHQIGEFFAV